MFKIFNHSSEKMSEIANDSIDLIVTDPPFNIGIKYSDYIDQVPTDTYFEMLRTVIGEIFRITKKIGKILFLTPLRLRIDGRDFEFRDIIEKEFASIGLNLIEERNFVISEDHNAVSVRDWNNVARTNMHSTELRILVFSKQDIKFSHNKKTRKITIKKAQGHPCPFSYEFANFIVENYCKPGFNVCDPFMGIARLGEKVIQNGGNFFGYEIRKEYFEIARERLEKA